jgi:eukaryotic-like serine/threonine-protein kinase
MTDDSRVEELLEELLESDSTPEEVCRDCPELLPHVRASWQQLRSLQAEVSALFPESSTGIRSANGASARPWPSPELPSIPGYEVREVVGHGGMGIVYKAWHLRLNRAVALKMLLAGALARPTELERLLREAESVAGLRHPNIVQVYEVGDVGGRPYFTMEFVEGGSLAQKMAAAPQPAREAAALVADIADAIEVAHQHGIIHRDLKPGNILLMPDGTPKLSDFGLARRLQGGNGLTVSGAALGTPSYMAPEQAHGTREIGPATDIYALGAILYDLLTGRPPFRADSSAATIQQVLADDPVPPARLNPRVPRDLETICLKCLNKEPSLRYTSAQAMADDLRRYQRGEPIAARPLGLLPRLVRWARRRPTAAALWGVAILTVLLTLALVGGGLWLSGQRQATTKWAEADLNEFYDRLQQPDWTGARATLERAKGRLGTDGATELQRRVQQAQAELDRREKREQEAGQLEKRLDAIRMDRCTLVDGHFDRLRSDREYDEAFRAAGLSPFGEEAKAVARRINESPARAALVAALDDWAVCAANKLRCASVLAVARLADPHPWRDRARDPLTFWDLARLQELTTDAPFQGQSVQLLVALGERLHTADPKAALPFLRRVQQAHPEDFFANFWVAHAEDPVHAVGYYRVAQALRPNTVVANANLGLAIWKQGWTEEALRYFQRAVNVDPRSPLAHAEFAEALRDFGQTDEAIDHYLKAIGLGAKWAFVHNNLAICLERKSRMEEAIAQYEEALRVDPRYAYAHYNFARALTKRERRDEAVKHFLATLAADPRFPNARAELATLLRDMGRLGEAADQFRQVVAETPTDSWAQEELREALIRQGRLEEARVAWRKALAANPSEHDAWFGYAELCLFLGQEDEYRRDRRELLTRFGSSTEPAVHERVGRACLLLPGTKEELEDAVALTDRAVAAGREGHESAYPYYWFAKGLADYRVGRYDGAIAAMRGEASNADLMGPSPRLIMAMALHQKGRKDQALRALAEAIVSYDWSAANADSHDPWIAHILRREAESLILPNLPAYLDGKYVPTDNDERLAFVAACEFKNLRAAEAGLLAAAFAANPMLADDLDTGLRYRAAKAAAVSGCGGGKDGAALSGQQRTRLRRQALAWLRADLAAWSNRLESAKPADRDKAQKHLAQMGEDRDLAGLRDAVALEKLPPAERQECSALWTELKTDVKRGETPR